MKVTHEIVTRVEGNLIEVLTANPAPVPTLAEVLETLKTLALIVALNPAFAANELAQAESDTAAAMLKAFAPVEV